MYLEANYLANLIRISVDVMKDYSNRIDISEKILNPNDINFIIERLEKLREILLSNQSRVNLIFSIVKFIINTKEEK